MIFQFDHCLTAVSPCLAIQLHNSDWMGIQDLWKILAPTAERHSLLQLAVTEGLIANRRGIRSIILGINANAWLRRRPLQPRFVRNQTPTLCALFYELARLLEFPVIPIFVFEEPPGGSHPHGQRSQHQQLIHNFKRLADAFGYYTHIAPEDPEAELAVLCRTRAVDAVVTDDIAAFVFGATHIIHVDKFLGDDGNDIVHLHRDTAIQSGTAVSLSQGDFVLMALLVGGRRNLSGIRGCGVTLALKLAINTALGDHLMQAAGDMLEPEFEGFLLTWREQLRYELAEDPHGYIGHRSPAVAAAITDMFPSVEEVLGLVDPVSHLSNGPPLSPVCCPRIPDLPRLGRLCEDLFEWASPLRIVSKFDACVWVGTCCRILLKSLTTPQCGEGLIEQKPPFTKVANYLPVTPTRAYATFHLAVSTGPLCDAVLSQVQGRRVTICNHGFPPAEKRVVLPAPLVEYALPVMVGEFRNRFHVPDLMPHTTEPPVLSPLRTAPCSVLAADGGNVVTAVQPQL